MPRKGPVARRPVTPDSVFGSRLVQRLINRVMRDGKKSTAERVCYGAFQQVHQKSDKDPLAVFSAALRNAMPLVEVRPRRVGGATYQVPIEVRASRREALGMRWLINAARARSGRTMVDRLAAEMMDAANGSGAAVKRREDTHRMAEANKAFAHYRW